MIIGREKEIAILNEKLHSKNSEFVALFGRRRVGKTFLIRNLFEGKFTFCVTGISQATLSKQLLNFNTAIKAQHPKYNFSDATNWFEAFQLTAKLIEKSKQKKKVIFFDELPWFDTAHAKFITALEHFWNSWASARKDVLLIVCGSAASWMINKLINNRGGLHNRITQKIKIEPFTLRECDALLNYKNIKLNHYQLVLLYMVLGGIPFYWEAIKKGLSADQNINKLCFEKDGLLTKEFDNLFQSLFAKAERHEAIIAALAKKNKGLTRDEICTASKLANGGGLTRLLNELEESGFIRRYSPYGRQYRNSLYQLSDFFSLFHIKFMSRQKNVGKNHWLQLIDSPAHRAWSGYAYEQVCLAHIPQITKALGISGVSTEISSWKSSTSVNGAQINLVIDRKDNLVNLCEMKFSTAHFAIDKKYDAELRTKAAAFRNETKTNKALFTTMITTYGLKETPYSSNISNNLSMDILFEKA